MAPAVNMEMGQPAPITPEALRGIQIIGIGDQGMVPVFSAASLLYEAILSGLFSGAGLQSDDIDSGKQG